MTMEFSKPEILREDGSIFYRFRVLKCDFHTFTNMPKEHDLYTVLHTLLNDNKIIEKCLEYSNSFFTKKFNLNQFQKSLVHKYTNNSIRIQTNIRLDLSHFDFTTKGIFMYWTPTDVSNQNSVLELPELLGLTQTSVNTPYLQEVHEIEQLNANAPAIDLEDDCRDSNCSENLVSEMSRNLARAKVREARLKARLARWKAERTTEKYLRQYGSTTNSEFDDSGTEAGTDTDYERDD